LLVTADYGFDLFCGGRSGGCALSCSLAGIGFIQFCGFRVGQFLQLGDLFIANMQTSFEQRRKPSSAKNASSTGSVNGSAFAPSR